MHYKYSWNEETGIATCTITKGNTSYTGTAVCHEDDEDMKNEKTGYTIATIRAEIAYYVAERDALAAQSQVLSELILSNKAHKKFNKKDRVFRTIVKKDRDVASKLEQTRIRIAILRKDLHELIQKKEALYQKIRANRSRGAEDKED